MAEPYKHAYTVDLNQPLKRFDVGDILASGDEKANCFEITVYRGEESVDLSGMAVYGYFIRPNDETFKVDGTVDGSVVRLEPSKSCYVFDGAFSFAVKLAGSGTTQTIAVLDGRIVRTTSENIVDGERVFYSLEDMLAQIAVMELASANATTAAQTANAATERANNAATAVENITASAIELESWADATVTVTDGNDGKHITFGIPKGEKGDKGDPGTIENVTITSIDGLPEALDGKLSVGGHDPSMYFGTDENGDLTEIPAPTKESIGLGNVANVLQYSAENEPPYPVTSVNGQTGAVTVSPYRVGDIYITTNSTSPAALFGGTWEQIKDRFLLSAGDTYAAGSTGGEAVHQLTPQEMPRHIHNVGGNSKASASDGALRVVSYINASTTAEEAYVWYAQSSSSGNDQPHNNMPPYLAVYIWKRVA